MEQKVVRAIAKALHRTIQILKIREEKDVVELKELSDQVIRYTSIYQDIDSVSIAVLIYSLYKIFDRKIQVTDAQYRKIFALMDQAYSSLGKRDFHTYNRSTSDLHALLKKLDKKCNYAQQIFQKASINKGSKLFAHGLSSTRAAEIMGVSKWELLDYVGKTKTESPGDEKKVLKRLAVAEDLFK